MDGASPGSAPDRIPGPPSPQPEQPDTAGLYNKSPPVVNPAGSFFCVVVRSPAP
jgi:hypothetical protein